MKIKRDFPRRKDAVEYLKARGWLWVYYHKDGSATLSHPTITTGRDVWKEKNKWKISTTSMSR